MLASTIEWSRFYRKMRKRFEILMDGDQPLDGRWNFDSENRQKLKPADLDAIPQPLFLVMISLKY